MRGRVFARFGDEGQRCVLSGTLDDSVGVIRFRKPEQGAREEEVGVIVLGWRRQSGWQRRRQRHPLGRLVWPLLPWLGWERLSLGHESLGTGGEERRENKKRQ